jgi:hypothetical protein
MALSDDVMKSALLALYADMGDYVMADDEFARRMAEITDTQVKTADVNTGIAVDGGTVSGGSLVDCQTSSLGTLS